MKKKKILIYTPYFDPEPFPINTFCEELVARDDISKVTVITSLPNYRKFGFYNGFSIFGPYREKSEKTDLIRIPVIPRLSNSGLSILLFYISFFISSSVFLLFFSLFNRNKYDHCITFCGSPVYVGYIGFFASKLLNTTSSQWVQDIWPEAIETTIGIKNKMIRNFIFFLQNKMWNFTDILFSESDSLTKYLKEEIKNKKIITLYNPIRTLSKFSNKTDEKNNKKIIFSYMGNMGGAQNLDFFLNCFNSAKLNNTELHMCGDGNQLNYLSQKYNDENIFWHGWLSGKKLDEINKISDYYILSLNSHGRQGLIIPSKIQSYFANNKPIICISLGAVKDLVKKTNAGFYCDSLDKKEVIKMFQNAEKCTYKERSSMANNGYVYYKKFFTQESIVNVFLKSI